MPPKISIVIPVLNGAPTLERTLESLRSQNYGNLEVIASDGASSDGTLDILNGATDIVTQVISAPDTGSAQALNRGFELTTGEVEGWLCADDALADGALKTVGAHFSENAQLDILTGGCRRFFPGEAPFDTQPSPDFYRKLTAQNTIEQPSTFWRRRARIEVGPLNERMRYAFDWELWCRFRRAEMNFQSIEDVLSEYHFSHTNLTSTGGRKIVNEMYQIVREYGPYDGRMALIYKFLYHVFDLNGFYDEPGALNKPAWQRHIFHATLRGLYRLFDQDTVNTYNWNWCSRQERATPKI